MASCRYCYRGVNKRLPFAFIADDIERQLVASSAKFVFTTPGTYGTVKKAVERTARDIKIACIKTAADEALPAGAIDFAEIVDPKGADFSLLRQHERHPDELLFLPFSSGTTGLPKGVMLSHNNIGVNCEQLHVKLGDVPLLLPTTGDFQEVCPSVLPFFHIYGLTVLMISKLSQGVKTVTLPSFTPQTFMKSITEHKATLLHLVPPIGEAGRCPRAPCRHSPLLSFSALHGWTRLSQVRGPEDGADGDERRRAPRRARR